MVGSRLVFEDFHDFFEILEFFVTKLRESTGDQSQSFSGALWARATRCRVFPYSLALKNLQKSARIRNLRGQPLYVTVPVVKTADFS